jgi:orotate phosphoribosyltransferase
MADQLFETNDLKLITLSDYNHLIQFAQSNEIITEEQLGLLAEWRANPNDWNPSMN